MWVDSLSIGYRVTILRVSAVVYCTLYSVQYCSYMTRNLNNSHLWDLKSDCTSAGSQYWYSALFRPSLWVGISLLWSVERVATYFTVQYSVHSIYIIWPYRSGSYDNTFLNLTKIVKYPYHDTTFSINQKKLQCFKFLVIFY